VGLRLCDLDETVWNRLPVEQIESLARLIVSRVAAGCARKVFHHRHFPRPPQGLALENLRLEHRTQLCLTREGLGKDLQALGDRTIGEVLALRAFGPRCLVDLLSAVETVLGQESLLSQELTEEAQRLAQLPEANLAQSADPRFGALVAEIDAEAASVSDLAARLLARSHDPPDPQYAVGQLRHLRRQIAALAKGTLEEELIQIFAAGASPRNRQILIGYYGWEDGQTRTLAEIGARHGMTRERTRQICAKLVRRIDPASTLAPVLDRTLALLGERLPCPIEELETAMAEAGLTRVGMRLSGVEEAARLLGRPTPFSVVRVDQARLAVDPEHAEIPAAAVELAKKEIYYHGAATVGRIVETMREKALAPVEPAVVRQSLQQMAGFRWLDEPTGWFRLAPTCKHGLPKAIEKVLAVAPEISVAAMRAAVSRNRRMWRDPPPEKVILEFCRQMPSVRCDGARVFADPPRDWRQVLTGVEARLVAILQEHGPVMDRGDLEDLCVRDGINRFSFHAFIACSPVIAQYGHSIYGLLGADVSGDVLARLVQKRRAERAPARVLSDHGFTADGRVWLSYRLSRAASTYAVITVPAALKEIVCGRFELVDEKGHRVGTLAARDGRAWGLGGFLRQRQTQIDDRIRITFDLKLGQAAITIEASNDQGRIG